MNQSEINCPNCSQKLPAGSQFCGACGYEIPPALAQPVQAKRRLALLWLVVGLVVMLAAAVAMILLLSAPQAPAAPSIEQQIATEGGVQLVFEVSAGEAPLDASLVESGLPVLRKRLVLARLDGLVEAVEQNRILVTMPEGIDPATVSDLLSDPGLLEIVDTGDTAPFPGDLVHTDFPSFPPQAVGPDDIVYHTILTNSSISTAEVRYNTDLNTWYIDFGLTPEGTQIFADFTTTHINQYAPIVYNHKCLMAPRIVSPITEGKASIQGMLTQAEAWRITNAMISGALPYQVTFIESRVIEPAPSTP